MAYAPCRNPSCPSYGKPHPNCQCSVEMAEGGMVPKGFEDTEPAEEQESNSSVPEGFEDIESEPIAKTNIPEGFEDKGKNYSTPSQQALTIAEGAVQGVPILGPLATKAELSLGVPAEDITGRAEANPWQHGVSKAGTAIGTALVPAFAGPRIASMGMAALQGFVTQAGMQASDEVTNYMLGQGDPDHPVGAAILHSGAAGLLGIFGGMVGAKGSQQLASLAEKNVGSKIQPFLEGIASAASGKPISSLAEEAEIATKLAGSKFYQGIMHTLMPHIGAGVGATEGALEGYHENGLIGAGKGLVTGAAIGAVADLLGRPVISRLTDALGKNAVAPFIAKILSSGSAQGLGDAINYATTVGGGLKTLDKSLDVLFKGGSAAGQQTFEDMFKTDASHEKELEDYLDNGGFQQNIDHTMQNQNQPEVPHFAEGGDVQPMKQPPPPKQANKGIYQNPGVAQHFPAQNTLMTTARARVSNYLMSLKPDPYAPKLPFDDPPDQTQQNKSYKKAMKIALNPMNILKEIHQGTIEPEDLTHFNSLYPETSSLIKNQLTKKIVQANLDGKKPPYHIRQGLSLLLGTNLSSDTDPSHIQAAQATFIKPQGEQQQGQQLPKSRKGSQALQKIANGYMTQTQARAQRQQKS